MVGVTVMTWVGVAMMIAVPLSIGIVDRFTNIGNHPAATVVFSGAVVLVGLGGLWLIIWSVS